MIDKTTLQLAKKLWNYHHVNQYLEKSDCILVLGSQDLRVAERGAEHIVVQSQNSRKRGRIRNGFENSAHRVFPRS
jgi:hypothetical protein